MIRICYIAKDRNHLTYDLKKAMRGRVVQGKREVVVADRQLLNKIKKDAAAGFFKFSFAQSLYDNIANDIRVGEPGGSYLISGEKLTPAKGGYMVGGAEQSTYRVPEIRLSEEECKDEGDIAAAIELMSDEIFKMENSGNAAIGFWRSGGNVCFDVSNWIEDLDAAKQVAFEERDEDAIYDLANDVEIFREASLRVARDRKQAFANFKQHTSEYRNASKEDRLYRSQAWYMSKTFLGFL